MNLIIKLLQKLSFDYRSILESYIESRNPTSVAEIDFLTKEFERRHFANWNY